MERKLECPYCTHKLFVPEIQEVELVAIEKLTPAMTNLGYLKCKKCHNQVAVTLKKSIVAA